MALYGALLPLRPLSSLWPSVPSTKDIRQKTVHRYELRGCGDLFIWFGGSLQKRFQGPLVCCLLLPQTIGCYWLLQWLNPVSIGFHRDQTSFQSSALYLWAQGKICSVKMSSSTLCCTVFLSNVFALHSPIYFLLPSVSSRAICPLYIPMYPLRTSSLSTILCVLYNPRSPLRSSVPSTARCLRHGPLSL
jgi:hypothetical protein